MVMKSFSLKSLSIFVVPCLIIASLGSITSAQAQSPITFDSPSTTNNFPYSLTFKIAVTSTAGDIVSAELVHAYQTSISSQSMTPEEVEFTPATQVLLEYVWKTDAITVPPSAPIIYFWRVTDSAGNKVESERFTIRYDDIRFDWQIHENDKISIWWHSKSANFGESVFNIANRAVTVQRELFQSELTYKIYIIIYNSHEEFNAWHAVPLDWVGGEAYTDYGITTQIVSGSAAQEYWLNDVIPHEISHLYFAQVTDNPTVAVPYWLNEGIAQYNEFRGHDWELSQVSNAAQNGTLIPLSSLGVGFGSHNEDRITLAYAEAVTAVIYMVEVYGETALAELLAGYKNGLTTDDAFQNAFGLTLGEFENGWAVWLGIPEGQYVTPTPWPFPTFRPSPTFGTASTQSSSQSVPSATPQQIIAEPSPVSETPLPIDTPNIDCCSNCLFIPFALLGINVMILRRRKRTSK
jgi:hypothetical protein